MKVGDEEYPLDGNGFLAEPGRWNKAVAEAIAREEWHHRNDRIALGGGQPDPRSLDRTRSGTPCPDVVPENQSRRARFLYKPLFRSGPAKGPAGSPVLPSRMGV